MRLDQGRAIRWFATLRGGTVAHLGQISGGRLRCRDRTAGRRVLFARTQDRGSNTTALCSSITILS